MTNIDNFVHVPFDMMPLFGDVYLALDKELVEKLTKVYEFNCKDYILKSQLEYVSFMPLSNTDCVYNGCFMHIMIKEAFRNGKDFIVA